MVCEDTYPPGLSSTTVKNGNNNMVCEVSSAAFNKNGSRRRMNAEPNLSTNFSSAFLIAPAASFKGRLVADVADYLASDSSTMC